MINENQLAFCLTSKERLSVYKSYINNIPNGYSNITKWRNVKNLVSDDEFREKLKSYNITENEFNFSIKDYTNEDIEEMMKYIKKANWYSDFHNLVNFITTLNLDFCNEELDLNYIIKPFTLYVKHKMNNIAHKVVNIVIDDNVVNEISIVFNQTILKLYFKSIVSEINKQINSEKLSIMNTDEVIAKFIKNNLKSKEDIINFYLSFPAITRIAIQKMNCFINFINETMHRLDNDIQDIKLTIGSTTTNVLKSVVFHTKWSYHKEYCDLVFIFSDNKRIFYKPRNFDIDKSYYKFIEWINKNSNSLDLHIARAVYRDNYAYKEFIHFKECETKEEVEKFYLRFGELTGVLYILCGNDFRFENLVAHGEYPIIVDLDKIIQPINKVNNITSSSDSVRIKIANESILSLGLIPFVISYVHDKEKKSQINNLNYRNKEENYKIVSLDNLDTNIMNYEYKDYKVETGDSLPRNNQGYAFKELTAFILTGFRNIMKIFLTNKDHFNSKDSILKLFENVITKKDIKPVHKYRSILDYSVHPNYTNDMLRRERLIENIWGYPHNNKEVVKYETDDLINNVIPLFFTKTNSTNLILSNGSIISNYFLESGLDRVRNRISNLSEYEISKQLSYMKVSFGKYDEYNNSKILNTKAIVSHNNFDNLNILKESIEIGNYIASNAIYSTDNTQISWEGVILNNIGSWEVSSLNDGLYDGNSGLALFFYELFKVTGDNKFYNLYVKSLNSSNYQPIDNKTISAYSGKISMIFPILNEYKHSGKSKYLYFIETIFDFVYKNKKEIKSIDWLSGLAGIISIFIEVYKVLDYHKAIVLANSLGRILIDDLNNKEIHFGMAHGFTGVALSLLKLWSVTNNKEYLDHALSLLDRERELVKSIDYLKLNSWYPGISGSSLAKIEILKYINNSQIEEEVYESIENIKNLIRNNDSICDGNMSDLELLVSFNEFKESDYIEDLIRYRLDNIFESKKLNGGYSVRSIPGFLSVDLFTGISGVGYQFLRILNPRLISNVLTLDIKSGKQL